MNVHKPLAVGVLSLIASALLGAAMTAGDPPERPAPSEGSNGEAAGLQAAGDSSSAQPSAAALARLKRDIRSYLQKQVRARLREPTVPKGRAADHWKSIAQYDDAGKNREKLYFIIAQQLMTVDDLLPQDDLKVQRSGLGIAIAAQLRLNDPILSVAICDAYLLPNLESADTVHWQYLSRNTVLKTAVMVYGEAKQHEKLVDAAKSRNSLWRSRRSMQTSPPTSSGWT